MEPHRLRLLDRIVMVLDCFTPERPRWALSQLERALPLSKSTIFRLLQGLEHHGFVRYDSATQQYHLGAKVLQLNRALVEKFDLRDVARPYLERLRDAIGETAGLFVRVGDRRVCLEMVESTHPIRRGNTPGVAQPMYPSTSGKVFLAYDEPHHARAILSGLDIRPITPNTITDVDAVMCLLAQVREQGSATSVEENLAGAWSIAAPIRQKDGTVEWVVAVTGPMLRYSPEKLEADRELLVRTAQELERRLAHGLAVADVVSV